MNDERTKVQPDPGDLPIQEGAALRRLARSLLFDAASADDVVQEAWVVALRRGIQVPDPGAWLRGVVRKLALQRRREESRRRDREEVAATGWAGASTGSPGTDELSGRLELTRRVVDAVDGLPEPYRTVIVLRFFDGLPPREIARRRGVPSNTVRTQVSRGLAKLRRELAAQEPDADVMLSALLPLVGPVLPFSLTFASGSSPLSKWIGAFLMSLKPQAVVAAVVTVSLVGVLGRSLGSEAKVELPSADTGGFAAPIVADIDSPKQETGAEAVEESAERFAVTNASRGGWRVHGTVQGDGEPLAGAKVELSLWDGYQAEGAPDRTATVKTDRHGRFDWSGEEPDGGTLVSLSVRRAGWLPRTEEVRVLGGHDPPALAVGLRRVDAWLVGRLVDTNGAPIPGAELIDWFVDTRSDGDGRFRVATSSTRDEVRVTARAPGFADERINALISGPGETLLPDVRMVPERLIRGRVVDPDGNGLSGARLSSRIFRPNFTHSNYEGRFRLPGVNPSAEHVNVYGWLDGWAPASLTLSREARDGAEFELVMHPGVRVEGVVHDELGQPVDGVQICLDNPPDVLPNVTTYSDASGEFAYPCARAGERAIYAVAEGFEVFEGTVVLVPGELIELTLQRGHSLGGVVVDGSGRPVPGALAYAEGEGRDRVLLGSVRADEEGRFRFDALPDQRITVGFLKDGYVREERTIEELDRDDLVITLRRSGRLAGRVVDGATGAPIDDFVLRFTDPVLEAGEERLWGYGATWSKGFPFVGTGGYWTSGDQDLDTDKIIGIEVRAEGYAPGLLTHVRVGTDPNPEDHVVELFAGVRFEGRVIARGTGEPVAGARVRRFTERAPLTAPEYAHDDEYHAETDALGGFVLEGLPVEPMFLAVEHDDFALRIEGPFDVSIGESTQALIEVDSGLSLSGILIGGEDLPLAGETIAVLAEEGPLEARTLRATTDEFGRFVMPYLLPGDYRVAWALEGEDTTIFSFSKEVSLREQDAEVELKLRGRVRLVGEVRAAEGDVPRSLAVSLWATDPSFSEGERAELGRGAIATDGRFRIDWIEPGSYLLQVMDFRAGSLFGGQLELVVPEDGEIEVTLPYEPMGR